MTTETALAVSQRLNELHVPTNPEICEAVDLWTSEGGLLVVTDLAEGHIRIDLHLTPGERYEF